MAFSVNTNEFAMFARQTLGRSSQALTATLQRVTTGQRVSSAAEDGAAFAIGKKTASDIAAWGAVRERQVFGRLVVETAASGATQISNILADLKKEAASYASPLTADQKRFLRDAVYKRLGDINSVVNNSKFNGVNLLSMNEPVTAGSATSSGAFTGEPTIQMWDSDWADHVIATGGHVSSGAPMPSGAATFELDYDVWVNPINIEVGFVNTGNGNYQTISTYTSLMGSGSIDVPWPGQSSGFNYAALTVTQAFGSSFDTRYNVSLINKAPVPQAAQTQPDGGSFSVIKDIDGDNFRVEYRCMTAEALGLLPFSFDPIESGLAQIDKAASVAGDNLSYWSGKGRLIDSSMKFESTMKDALEMANSSILDADMAVESAKLEAEKIKEQLASQTLGIANGAPELLLGLFK